MRYINGDLDRADEVDAITSLAALDDAGIDVDLATWELAIAVAAQATLKLVSGLSVSSLSLDHPDLVNTIEYRSQSLPDRQHRD